jgi:uncharacterized protein YjbI with pentapeptide repeats
MTNYGRTRGDVVRWPDDSAAREALATYLDALPRDSGNVMEVLDAGGLNLTGADLSGLELLQAEFSEADLNGVRLVQADLDGAWLLAATLRGADLTQASLRKALGRGCDAQDAVLREADLRSAEFEGATLCRADLRKAQLAAAWFPNADLRNADLRETVFGGATSATYLTDARMAGCLLDGATGRVAGPVDVGADAPHLLDGADLQRWFADQGATGVFVKQPIAL